MNQGNQLLLVWRRSVAVTHAHAAEPDSRNFQVAVSKFALLHFLIPFARLNPLVPARTIGDRPAGCSRDRAAPVGFLRKSSHVDDIEVTFSVSDLFFLICGISIPL